MPVTPEMFNTESESALNRLPLAAENSAEAASSFATVEDLEKRWHALTQEERERAELLLSDASEIIRTRYPHAPDRVSAEVLRAVVCAMVRRAMTSADREGITQETETTGPFSNSFTYANPGQNLYITKEERELLGQGLRAFHIDLTGGRYAD